MTSEILDLLYKGARPQAEKLARRLPLLDIFEAAGLGALEALIERLEEDASAVDSVAQDGWTPLHLAAFFGNNECIKELLRRGATIDAVSQNQMRVTPLQSACAGNHTLAVATLVAKNADVNAEQEGGYRALDAALDAGNEEIVHLLRLAGAHTGHGGRAEGHDS
ncbi:MAG: ankyrin repeat domain-containing protein [Candidatus Velthaea sp.]